MTYLSDIYENFLSKVSEYRYASQDVTVEEVEEELSGYLKTAIANFYKCKKSLKIVSDEMTGDKKFQDELTQFEIEILSSLMLVEYMKPIVLSSENMKQALSDKDFRIHSQSSQLRENSLTYRMLKKDAEKMITKYTYLDLGKDDG